MRTIDMQNWPRRIHFERFRAYDHPFFGMCANVELTAFYPAVKQRGLSINIAIVYVLARVANEIPEFRQRIRGDQVVEHDIVHPSSTILTDDDLFTFCSFEYLGDFAEFARKASGMVEFVKNNPTLEDAPGLDNLLFMTAIPWVSFNSFTHPMHLSPADSVPRLSWGKIFEQGPSLLMPLDVQAHHALMDGVHMGRYFARVQQYFSDPNQILGDA